MLYCNNALAGDEKWAHWCALLDVAVQQTFGLKPFSAETSATTGGNVRSDNVVEVAKAKVFDKLKEEHERARMYNLVVFVRCTVMMHH